MKRILSLFLALTISLSIVIIDNKTSYASTDTCINASSYTGTYDSSTPMEFTINSVNKDNGTFTGHVKINHQYVTINKDISGSIKLNSQSFVHFCNLGYRKFLILKVWE